MSTFIVNPPITDDANYYRSDDDVVQRVLKNESMLVAGLRRSGKTSFLYRVQRAAQAANQKSLFLDLNDLFIERNIARQVTETVRLIEKSDATIILLDEAEALRKEQRLLEKLLNACRKRTVVVTCAPVFILELNSYSNRVQAFFEPLPRHTLGLLDWKESRALLSQAKRPRPIKLRQAILKEIERNGDRLPIILQALGAKHADGIDLNVSLGQFGGRVLAGLTPKARDIFVSVAHGGEAPLNSNEVKLLIGLGALHSDEAGKLRVAGKVLDDFVRDSTDPPDGLNGADHRNGHPAEWQPYTSILHLSDLHFGPHCIENDAAEKQLARLRTALERDGAIPDFVVVTGDLSWSGHPNELRQAEQFLDLLVLWLAKAKGWRDKQTRQRILLIPGNHEAAWTLTNGLNDDEQEIWSCYSLSPFANLVHRFHRGEVHWDVERPCHRRCYTDPSVAFICVSTAHLITQKTKRGQFGDAVRGTVVNLLEHKEVRGARFRIGLIHHNLRAFHRDGEVILDGELAGLHFAKCKPGLDMILHGHVHQGEVNFFAPREGTNISYSAVGSFGVRADHRPGNDRVGRIPNEFSVVYLETKGSGRRFTTQFYQLTLTPAGDWEWRAATRKSSTNL